MRVISAFERGRAAFACRVRYAWRNGLSWCAPACSGAEQGSERAMPAARL
jgi:hypothetical protein